MAVSTQMIRMISAVRTVLLAVSILFWMAPVSAQSLRTALVIGNANHTGLNDLANPVRDAEAIGAALAQNGFTVFLATDITLDALKTALETFEQQSAAANISLVYFAGHGAQTASGAYLLGTDFRANRSATDTSAVSISAVVERLSRPGRSNLFFFDACLDIAPSRGNVQSKTASIPASFVDLSQAPNSFVGYSTTPGKVAYDGAGTHSPFSGALLNHMNVHDLSIEALFKQVRRDVAKTSGLAQVPVSYSNLMTDVTLAGQSVARPLVPQPRSQRRSNSFASALSETGFSGKTILGAVSTAVVAPADMDRMDEVLSTLAHAEPDLRIRTDQEKHALRQLLCSQLSAPLPESCLGQ